MDIDKSSCNVAHIITGLSTGGAERMLYSLLSRTNRRRFQPVVVSLMDRGRLGDRLEALGIPVYTIGMKPGMPPTPGVMWRLMQTVRQIKPNFIQGWMYHGNLAAQFASSLQIPVIWGIHHSISALSSEKRMTRAVIRLGARLSHLPTRTVFVSQTSKMQHEAIGYSSNNSCVIPNGFDTSLFLPSTEARLKVRAELGLAADQFLIGLIGRYHPMKDHANFLQAATLLLKEYPVHFLLAGCDVNPENQHLSQLMQGLDSRHIHLLGERSDMPNLTAALDIAVSASAYGEAFPLVVGEAMSCGVPCVVTDVGDSGWIVGNTGRVVPPRNPQALADAWRDLLDSGPQGRATLGTAARKRIIQHFALDSVVANYEALYE